MERATESDLQEIFEVVNAAYDPEIGDSGFAFKTCPRFVTVDEVRNYMDGFWILRNYAKGEIIGCVCARVANDTVHIGPIAVNPSCQRLGVGSKILNFAETLATYAILEVVSCRSDLLSFYSRRSFKVSKAFPILDFVPLDRITRKDLQMIQMVKSRTSPLTCKQSYLEERLPLNIV